MFWTGRFRQLCLVESIFADCKLLMHLSRNVFSCKYVYLFHLTWTVCLRTHSYLQEQPGGVAVEGEGEGGGHTRTHIHTQELPSTTTVSYCRPVSSSTGAAKGSVLVPGRLHWRRFPLFPLFTRAFEQVHLSDHKATAAASTQTH